MRSGRTTIKRNPGVIVVAITEKFRRYKRRRWRSIAVANNKVLAVTVENPEIGMFAHLNVTLRVLRYANENGLRPLIEFESPNYSDPRLSKGWFGYHFDLVDRPRPLSPLLGQRIKTHRDLGLSRPDDLSLDEAGRLWRKYVAFKPEIETKVASFCAQYDIGAGSLGVHYRGTDKGTEADRVSYDNALAAIRSEGSKNPGARIFVASDEQRFVDHIVAAFPPGQVCAYADSARATEQTPLHLGGREAGNFEMGQDALINCLILSRCGTVVRTCSLLSSWASIFNPALDVVLLNESFDNTSWYPERLIARQARKPEAF